MSNQATLEEMQRNIARGNDVGEHVLTWDPQKKRLVMKPAQDTAHGAETLEAGIPDLTVSLCIETDSVHTDGNCYANQR